MGCDIHLHVEKRLSGRWHSINKTETKTIEQKGEKPYHYTQNYYGYEGRSYDLFAVLADVRNGTGFAGCLTGDYIEPISAPKGMPDDASGEAREDCEGWDGDGHSHSFLSLTELLAYDWKKSHVKHGLVSVGEMMAMRARGPGALPESWCGGTSGAKITLAEFEKRAAKGDFDDARQGGFEGPYVPLSWSQPLLDPEHNFLAETLPRLQELAKESPAVTFDDVRIVFWFDN